MGSEFAWDRSLHGIGVYMDLEFAWAWSGMGLERHGLRR